MTTGLSIVLPLRDRAEFTKRFLKSALPCGRIIIADGSTNRQWDAASDDVDYFYAGPDVNLMSWWTKMVKAFDRVETPYAMVADNDDLVIRDGVLRCIEFLEQNPDYVAAAGRIQGFWCYPDKVYGPHRKTTRRYALFDVPVDYSSANVNQRVLAGFQSSWAHYAIYRTQALRTIWREVYDMNLTNLQIHEKFCAMRALSLGKVMGNGSFTHYMRQYETSDIASHNVFSTNLFTTNFYGDAQNVFEKMAECGGDTNALQRVWIQWFEGFLYREYGNWKQFRRAMKYRYPRLAKIAQNRHRYLPLKWSYR